MMKKNIKKIIAGAALFFFLVSGQGASSASVEFAVASLHGQGHVRTEDAVIVPRAVLARGLDARQIAQAPIVLPASLGSIEEFQPAASVSKLPTIVHLQTAHGDEGAQMALVRVLNYLKKNQGFDLLLLEGADDKLEPALDRFFEKDTWNREVARERVKKGRMSGAAYFLMRQPEGAVKALGVESAEAYRDNRRDFLTLIKERASLESFLKKTESDLDRLFAKNAAKSILDLRRQERAFQQERLDWANWIEALKKAALADLNLDLEHVSSQKDWPALLRFIWLSKKTQAVTRPGLPVEDEGLPEAVNRILNKAHDGGAFHYGEARLILEEWFSSKNKIENQPSAEQIAVLTRMVLQNEIKPEELWRETESLTHQIMAVYAKTPIEKKLLRLDEDLKLLRGLLLTELSFPEYQRALERGHTIAPSQISQTIQRLSVAKVTYNSTAVSDVPQDLSSSGPSSSGLLTRHLFGGPAGSIDDSRLRGNDKTNLSLQNNPSGTQETKLSWDYAFDTALAFYSGAKVREKKMAAKVTSLLKQNVADLMDRPHNDNEPSRFVVLVTGGFHSEGLRDEFVGQGVSYMRVTPRAHRSDDSFRAAVSQDPRAVYRQVFLEHSRRPEKSAQIEDAALLPLPMTDLNRLGVSHRGFIHNRTEVLADWFLAMVGRANREGAEQEFNRSRFAGEYALRAEWTGPKLIFSRSEMRAQNDATDGHKQIQKELRSIDEALYHQPQGMIPEFSRIQVLLAALYGGAVQLHVEQAKVATKIKSSQKHLERRSYHFHWGLYALTDKTLSKQLPASQRRKIQTDIKKTVKRLAQMDIRVDQVMSSSVTGGEMSVGAILTHAPAFQNPFLHTFLGDSKQLNFAVSAQSRLERAVDILTTYPAVKGRKITPAEVLYLRSFDNIFIPVFKMGENDPFIVRVQHNSVRGPYKGGIRLVDAFTLVHDKHFKHLFDDLKESLTLQELRYFLRKYILEETLPLSFGMTSKTAVVNLPYGGGKGTMLVADVVQAEEGEKRIEDLHKGQADIVRYLFQFARGTARVFAESGTVRSDNDIPAADLNSGRYMDVMANEQIELAFESIQPKLQAVLTRKASRLPAEDRAFIEALTQVPPLTPESLESPLYLQQVTKFGDQLRKAGRKVPSWALPLFEAAAAYTSKSEKLMGSVFRNESTGVGGIHVLKEVVRREGLGFSEERPLEGLTAKLMGLGNVGAPAAEKMLAEGMMLKLIALGPLGAVAKSEGGFTSEEIALIRKMLAQKVNLSQLGQVGYEAFGSEYIEPAQVDARLLELDVDVFVLAAVENAIHVGNVAQARGRFFLELANGAITNEAYDRLTQVPNTMILPDTLANAGGVTVSYYEWLQNLSNERWSREDVINRLEQQLSHGVERVAQMRETYKTDWRTAADILMITEVLDARRAKKAKPVRSKTARSEVRTGAGAPAHASGVKTGRFDARTDTDVPAHVSNSRTGRSEVRAVTDVPAHVSNSRTGRSEVRGAIGTEQGWLGKFQGAQNPDVYAAKYTRPGKNFVDNAQSANEDNNFARLILTGNKERWEDWLDHRLALVSKKELTAFRVHLMNRFLEAVDKYRESRPWIQNEFWKKHKSFHENLEGNGFYHSREFVNLVRSFLVYYDKAEEKVVTRPWSLLYRNQTIQSFIALVDAVIEDYSLREFALPGVTPTFFERKIRAGIYELGQLWFQFLSTQLYKLIGIVAVPVVLYFAPDLGPYLMERIPVLNHLLGKQSFVSYTGLEVAGLGVAALALVAAGLFLRRKGKKQEALAREIEAHYFRERLVQRVVHVTDSEMKQRQKEFRRVFAEILHDLKKAAQEKHAAEVSAHWDKVLLEIERRYLLAIKHDPSDWYLRAVGIVQDLIRRGIDSSPETAAIILERELEDSSPRDNELAMWAIRRQLNFQEAEQFLTIMERAGDQSMAQSHAIDLNAMHVAQAAAEAFGERRHDQPREARRRALHEAVAVTHSRVVSKRVAREIDSRFFKRFLEKIRRSDDTSYHKRQAVAAVYIMGLTRLNIALGEWKELRSRDQHVISEYVTRLLAAARLGLYEMLDELSGDPAKFGLTPNLMTGELNQWKETLESLINDFSRKELQRALQQEEGVAALAEEQMESNTTARLRAIDRALTQPGAEAQDLAAGFRNSLPQDYQRTLGLLNDHLEDVVAPVVRYEDARLKALNGIADASEPTYLTSHRIDATLFDRGWNKHTASQLIQYLDPEREVVRVLLANVGYEGAGTNFSIYKDPLKRLRLTLLDLKAVRDVFRQSTTAADALEGLDRAREEVKNLFRATKGIPPMPADPLVQRLMHPELKLPEELRHFIDAEFSLLASKLRELSDDTSVNEALLMDLEGRFGVIVDFDDTPYDYRLQKTGGLEGLSEEDIDRWKKAFIQQNLKQMAWAITLLQDADFFTEFPREPDEDRSLRLRRQLQKLMRYALLGINETALEPQPIHADFYEQAARQAQGLPLWKQLKQVMIDLGLYSRYAHLIAVGDDLASVEHVRLEIPQQGGGVRAVEVSALDVLLTNRGLQKTEGFDMFSRLTAQQLQQSEALAEDFSRLTMDEDTPKTPRMTRLFARNFARRIQFFSVVGRPGAGKGLVSRRFLKELNSWLPKDQKFVLLVTGDWFRGVSRLLKSKPLPQDEERYGSVLDILPYEVGQTMAQGELVSDEVTARFFKAVLELPQYKGRKILFDVLPRTPGQLAIVNEGNILHKIDLFFVIDTPEETAVQRILAEDRGREDDTEDAIRRRMAQFEETTAPMIADLQRFSHTITVHGERPREAVYRELLGKVSRFTRPEAPQKPLELHARHLEEYLEPLRQQFGDNAVQFVAEKGTVLWQPDRFPSPRTIVIEVMGEARRSLEKMKEQLNEDGFLRRHGYTAGFVVRAGFGGFRKAYELRLYAQPGNRTSIVPIQFPEGGLKGQSSIAAPGLLMDLGEANLVVSTWPQRSSEPFTSEEEKIFTTGEGLSDPRMLEIEAGQVRNIRHSFYDRRSGLIEVKAAIETNDGRTVYVIFGGATTSSLQKLKALQPTMGDLRNEKTLAQISMGNQGDLEGNFTVQSEGDSWKLFAANDEHQLFERSYRVLVEFVDSTRKPGTVRFTGDSKTQEIHSVFFSPEDGSSAAFFMDPKEVKFILSAYVLGWGAEPIEKLLREQYTPTADFRHLFNFPFVTGQYVFYDQLLADDSKLQLAFQNKPIDFVLNLELQGNHALMKSLEINGYKPKAAIEDVLSPGDYFLSGSKIRIVFQPAVYPVNALLVSRDGRHSAALSVQGASGRIGADYWRVFDWAKKEILQRLNWEPFALFSLDNGMDPNWSARNGDGSFKTIVAGGRDGSNAALLIHEAPRNLPVLASNSRTGRSEVRAVTDVPAHVSNSRTGRSEVRAKKDGPTPLSVEDARKELQAIREAAEMSDLGGSEQRAFMDALQQADDTIRADPTNIPMVMRSVATSLRQAAAAIQSVHTRSIDALRNKTSRIATRLWVDNTDMSEERKHGDRGSRNSRSEVRIGTDAMIRAAQLFDGLFLVEDLAEWAWQEKMPVEASHYLVVPSVRSDLDSVLAQVADLFSDANPSSDEWMTRFPGETLREREKKAYVIGPELVRHYGPVLIALEQVAAAGTRLIVLSKDDQETLLLQNLVNPINSQLPKSRRLMIKTPEQARILLKADTVRGLGLGEVDAVLLRRLIPDFLPMNVSELDVWVSQVPGLTALVAKFHALSVLAAAA